MRTRQGPIAAKPCVLAVLFSLLFGASGVEAQSRACQEGQGGIMTDIGFELDRPLIREDVQPARSAPRFAEVPTITEVRQDGPAAGRLQEGDVILAVAGQPITSAEAGRLYAAIQPGDRIEFSIRRGEQRLDETIVALGRCIPHPPAPPEAPAAPAAPAPEAPPAPAPPTPEGGELMPEGWLGFTIRCDDCADDPATGVLRFNAPPVVAHVEPGSPAAAAGVRAGDRLTHINGESLTSRSGWARFYAIQPGEVVRFRIARNGRSDEVTLEAREPRGRAGASETPGQVLQILPDVDHHEHLFSDAAAELGSPKPLSAVELPTGLDHLLSERARLWDDLPGLTRLYTENSIAFDAAWPAWWQGDSAVATHVTRRFGKAYELTPTVYEVEGSGGYVTGYYSRGEGESLRHFGHFVLALLKDPTGTWKIAAETPFFPGPERLDPYAAEDLIAEMDSAGIARAVVLSVAYWYGSPLWEAPVENEYAKVRAENDWVSQQVSLYPERLIAFCSFNPLADYALDELERCHEDLGMSGLKLHFGNSGVDVHNPDHLERVRRVFEAANDRRLPIVIHLWTDPAYEREGAQDAEVFLNQILPAASDITVQVAHMAGGGRSTDSALEVFADAIASGDPRTRNLYFDVATLTSGQNEEGLQRDAMRMRQIGFDRILWGSDGGKSQQLWREFRVLMPLTMDEIRAIANNVAPYLR